MKSIHQFLVLFSALMLTIFFALPISAEERATKEECVAKVNAAVKLIQEEGPDAAFKKIVAQDGPYVWKDSYVFCIGDKVGKNLAYPVPKFLGFPMKNFRDEEGNQPFVEIIEVANKEGKGWKSYYYSSKKDPKLKLKNNYFAKVPGENVIVIAGYYE